MIVDGDMREKINVLSYNAMENDEESHINENGSMLEEPLCTRINDLIHMNRKQQQ